MIVIFLSLVALARCDVTAFVAPRTGVVDSRGMAGTTGPGPGDTKFIACDSQTTFIHLDASSSLSYFFELSQFDLSAIPAGASFDGLEVEIALSVIQGAVMPFAQAVGLEITFDGQKELFPNQAVPLDRASGRFVFGSPTFGTARFGQDFSCDRVKKSQEIAFRFQTFRGATRQLEIDCARLRVFYTPAATTTTPAPTPPVTPKPTPLPTPAPTPTPTPAPTPLPPGATAPPPTPAPPTTTATTTTTTTTAAAATDADTTPAPAGASDPAISSGATAAAPTTTAGAAEATKSLQIVAGSDTVVAGAPEESGGIEWWIIVVIVVAVVLLAAVIAYVVWRRRQNASWPSARSADNVYKWDDDGSSKIQMTE